VKYADKKGMAQFTQRKKAKCGGCDIAAPQILIRAGMASRCRLIYLPVFSNPLPLPKESSTAL
jgi:hypothetical protein